MKKNILIFCLLFLCLRGQSQSVSSIVSVTDFNFYTDTLTPNASHLSVNLLVDSLNKIDKVYINVLDENGKILVSKKLNVKDQQGQYYYYLDENGDMVRNWSGHVNVNMKINKNDLPLAKSVSVYTEKKGGSKTNAVKHPISQ